jgi:hypothetical protein
VVTIEVLFSAIGDEPGGAPACASLPVLDQTGRERRWTHLERSESHYKFRVAPAAWRCWPRSSAPQKEISIDTRHMTGNSHTDNNRCCSIDTETPTRRYEHNQTSRNDKTPVPSGVGGDGCCRRVRGPASGLSCSFRGRRRNKVSRYLRLPTRNRR